MPTDHLSVCDFGVRKNRPPAIDRFSPEVEYPAEGILL